MSYYQNYIKEYQQSPKGKFIRQKANAIQRGICWELTFEEWQQIWEASGKWEKRGRRRGCYVMGRTLDDGPYSIGNVKIMRTEDNSRDSFQLSLKRYKPKKQKPLIVVEKPQPKANIWPLNWKTPKNLTKYE